MTTNAILARRAFLANLGRQDRAIAAVIIQVNQKTADRPGRQVVPTALRSNSPTAIGNHR